MLLRTFSRLAWEADRSRAVLKPSDLDKLLVPLRDVTEGGRE
jgi:hypothetical protein